MFKQLSCVVVCFVVFVFCMLRYLFVDIVGSSVCMLLVLRRCLFTVSWFICYFVCFVW